MTADSPPRPEESAGSPLHLTLEGFEGPIDLLLALARDQKVDLRGISILALAEQYLTFVHEARRQRLDLAAEYLVMAAWLAWLKSRLLLPAEDSPEDEPTGAEMAAALAFQLERLEAMRTAAEALATRPRRGRDVFARGAPEGTEVVRRPRYQAGLYDLLKAYADHHRRQGRATTLSVEAFDLYSVEEALHRLQRLVGRLPGWTVLSRFLPREEDALERIAPNRVHAVNRIGCVNPL